MFVPLDLNPLYSVSLWTISFIKRNNRVVYFKSLEFSLTLYNFIQFTYQKHQSIEQIND